MKRSDSRTTGRTITFIAFVALGVPIATYAMGGMGGGMTGGGMMGGYGGGGGMMGGAGMSGGPGTGSGYGYRRGYDESRRQGGNDLNSHAGQLYAQTCSRCHALPDPRQHSADQWPGVVARMEGYMRQRNLPRPNADEVKEIDTFLLHQAQANR